MAKRKLTTQQKRRLEGKRSKSEIDRAEKSEISDKSHLGEEQSGLVITSFGKRVLVEDNNANFFNCAIRQHLGKLVAGDKVIWQTDLEEHSGVVVSLQPRSHELSRPGFRGQTRMIAANIDQILIMAPIEPGVHPDMIDRYLVTAHQLDIPVVILLNKIDLIENDQQWEEVANKLLPYDELEIPIYPISTETHEGLEELLDALSGKNNVIVGPSGAGKSSLIQTLIPDIEIKVSELSESTGLGKHTTTNPILYHLPEKLGLVGNIIDSPGVREFTPTSCSLKELEQAYPDFDEFLGHCKFHNCTHSNEPSCAIKQALENEAIYPSRYQSFQRLREEFANKDS
jgi:ribosome biogenesis GTPase